ncbi:hypothetical protein LPJ57_002952, partial [Coemansia sp. RSA 486]
QSSFTSTKSTTSTTVCTDSTDADATAAFSAGAGIWCTPGQGQADGADRYSSAIVGQEERVQI